MLPNCFDYIFVHLRQKYVSSPRFLSNLGTNQVRTWFESEPDPKPTRKAWPDLQLCDQQQHYRAVEYLIKSCFIVLHVKCIQKKEQLMLFDLPVLKIQNHIKFTKNK